MSKLDISFNVCLFIRFQSDMKESHITIIKGIVRYVIHIPFEIFFLKYCDMNLWYTMILISLET